MAAGQRNFAVTAHLLEALPGSTDFGTIEAADTNQAAYVRSNVIWLKQHDAGGRRPTDIHTPHYVIGESVATEHEYVKTAPATHLLLIAARSYRDTERIQKVTVWEDELGAAREIATRTAGSGPADRVTGVIPIQACPEDMKTEVTDYSSIIRRHKIFDRAKRVARTGMSAQMHRRSIPNAIMPGEADLMQVKDHLCRLAVLFGQEAVLRAVQVAD